TRGVGSTPEARLTGSITGLSLLKIGTGALEIAAPLTAAVDVAAGTLILSGNNTSGAPSSASGGALRIGSPTGLSANTNVNLSGGGVLEGSAAFTSLSRNIGTSAGQIRWTGDGGFSATGADFTV